MKNKKSKSLENEMECPQCLGTGEEVKCFGDDFEQTQVEPCTLCLGKGKIPEMNDKYSKPSTDEVEEEPFNEFDYE